VQVEVGLDHTWGDTGEDFRRGHDRHFIPAVCADFKLLLPNPDDPNFIEPEFSAVGQICGGQ
jgi:hypothetical protein